MSEAPQAQDPLVGTTVDGRYTIERPLASGGMGSVYLARQKNLARPVAVKVVTNADPDLIERFRREAEALSAAAHPAIVEVHDFISAEAGGGRCYLVMSYVEGQNLEDYLDGLPDRAVSPAEAVGLVTPIASALVQLHSSGIVHRDIKPANIIRFEGADGRPAVKLVDFGIARRAVDTSLTSVGYVIGTPPYMAPESLMAKPHTPLADVYALGATLFELVTGAPPHGQGQLFEIMQRALKDRARLPAFLEGTSLGWLLEQMLEREEERRPDALQVLSGLERVRDELAAQRLASGGMPIVTGMMPGPAMLGAQVGGWPTGQASGRAPDRQASTVQLPGHSGPAAAARPGPGAGGGAAGGAGGGAAGGAGGGAAGGAGGGAGGGAAGGACGGAAGAGVGTPNGPWGPQGQGSEPRFAGQQVTASRLPGTLQTDPGSAPTVAASWNTGPGAAVQGTSGAGAAGPQGGVSMVQPAGDASASATATATATATGVPGNQAASQSRVQPGGRPSSGIQTRAPSQRRSAWLWLGPLIALPVIIAIVGLAVVLGRDGSDGKKTSGGETGQGALAEGPARSMEEGPGDEGMGRARGAAGQRNGEEGSMSRERPRDGAGASSTMERPGGGEPGPATMERPGGGDPAGGELPATGGKAWPPERIKELVAGCKSPKDAEALFAEAKRAEQSKEPGAWQRAVAHYQAVLGCGYSSLGQRAWSARLIANIFLRLKDCGAARRNWISYQRFSRAAGKPAKPFPRCP